MVMHASKQPRFDDGHVDKRDTHLCQSTHYPSKAYGDRYGKQDSSRSRDDSPTSRDSSRYINKKSYIEKDKNRMERAGTGYNSPDKKISQASASSSYRGGSQNGSYGKTDPKSSLRDGKDQKAEVQKSAMRTCGNWSEHISSSGKQYYYNCKSEVSQWEKPKEWDDGSAVKHDRSKDIRGIEKFDMSRNRGTSNDRTSQSSADKYRRPSGLEYNPSLHSEKPDKQYLFRKFQDSQRQAQMESRTNVKHNLSTSSSSSSSAHVHRTPYSTEHSKSDSHHYRKDGGNFNDHAGMANSRNRYHRDSNEGNRSHHGQRTPRKNDSQLDDMDISPDTTPTSSRPSSCAGTPQLGPTSTPASITTPGSASIATMAATSTSSAPLISSIPQLLTQLSGGQNNQELTQKALQTLQKLQEVISRQIAQQTNPSSSGSNSQHSSQVANDLISQTIQQPPVSKLGHPGHSQQLQQHRYHMNSHPQVALSSPQQLTLSNHIISHQGKGGHITSVGAPNSVYGIFGQNSQPQTFKPLHVETSSSNTIVLAGGGVSGTGGGNSPSASPTSTTSSQGLPVPVEEGEGLNKTESPSVSSSLSQYYNDKLIGHVTGWQADHAERQALRYWEEGISVGTFHCGQVSVELKRARSLVRLAEIQSTLHEQRILFLSQQVHELESMKAPSFSSSQSFNSSTQ